jgi:hypothetical protein
VRVLRLPCHLGGGFWTYREFASDEDAEAPRTRRGTQPGKTQKQYLRKRDRQKCRICLRELEPEECTAHHVHPSSRGGLPVPENLVITCEDCNQRAGTTVLPVRSIMNSERVRELSPGEIERIFELTHTPEEARTFFDDLYRMFSEPHIHLGPALHT